MLRNASIRMEILNSQFSINFVDFALARQS